MGVRTKKPRQKSGGGEEGRKSLHAATLGQSGKFVCDLAHTHFRRRLISVTPRKNLSVQYEWVHDRFHHCIFQADFDVRSDRNDHSSVIDRPAAVSARSAQMKATTCGSKAGGLPEPFVTRSPPALFASGRGNRLCLARHASLSALCLSWGPEGHLGQRPTHL